MKTYYKFLTCFLIVGLSVLNFTAANAQCTNSTQYGSATIDLGGASVTISTCSYYGEFSPVSGAVSGQTLTFTLTGATAYITVHSGSNSGPIVASGPSPLTFANTYTGTLYPSWSISSSDCSYISGCQTTTVQCMSCAGPPPVGCTNTTQYGSATIDPSGAIVTISTCSYYGEFSPVSGAVAGQTLTFTLTGATAYITVHSGSNSGPIVASGPSPLTFANTYTGTLYPSWSISSTNCSYISGCQTTTVQYILPPPPGCTNSSSYGAGTINTSGALVTISTCSYGGEYSTVSGAVAGQTLQFTMGSGGGGTWITIHSGSPSGPILASGASPLTFANTYTGTLYAHWNTNSSCGTYFGCLTTTVQCMSCAPPPSGCTNSSSYGSGTINTSGALVTISTCSYGGEYSTVFGAVAGQSLQFTMGSGGGGTYITIHSGTPSGPILASGASPLTYANTYTGTLYAHWNTNSSCGTYFGCLVTTVQCMSCAPAGCTFTSSYGAAVIPANNILTTISTCSFAGEYSTVSGAVAGQTLQFTFLPSGYITVHSGTPSGPIIAAGASPLTFANTYTGTIYPHWSLNAACGTDFSCHTTTVQCTSCPPPSAVGDLCSTAIPIACGQTITGNTSGASGDVVPCGYGSASPSVWYKFIGDGQNVTASMCGSSFDTYLSAFSSTSACGPLTCVTSNDDFCGLQSQITFSTVAGTQYYLYVHGWANVSGAFTLTRTCVVPAPAPVNDQCQNVVPVVITCGVNQVFTGTTAGATTINDGVFGDVAATVWHAFTLTTTFASLDVQYCGTGPGILANVFINLATDCPAANGFFYTSYENASCGDGNYTLHYNNVPPGTYYIPVGAGLSPNVAGPYTVTVVCTPPPANDVPCGAVAVSCGTSAQYSNAGSSIDASEPFPPGGNCGSNSDWCQSPGSNSVWFSFTTPVGGNGGARILIASGGTTGIPSFDSQVALWDPGAAGTCGDYTGWSLVAANDDDPLSVADNVYVFASAINIPALTLVPGRTYFIQVDGYFEATGSFRVVITCPPGTPPVITCPADAIICSAGASFGTPTTVSSPQGPVTYTNDAPAVLPLGVPTLVTWTGTEPYGLTATCTQTVTRHEAPQIVSITSPTLNGGAATPFTPVPNIPVFTETNSCDKVVNYAVSITGDPDPDEIVGGVSYSFSGSTVASGSGTGSGSTFTRILFNGQTTAFITATNVCGSQTKQFRVTVTDNVAPIITPLEVPTTNTNAGSCASLVVVTPPDACNLGVSDNCMTVFGTGPCSANVIVAWVSRSDGRAQNDLYYEGTTVVTWAATDAVGNTSTATQNVVVVNIKPVVTSFTASNDFIYVNGKTRFSTTFTDEAGGGPYTVKFYRDKGDASPANIQSYAGSGTTSNTVLSDSIQYTLSEVAEPKVEVVDGCNLAADQVPGVTTIMYLPVAVAGSQFTTGGGNFTIPAGASAYEGLQANVGDIVKKATTGNSFKGQFQMNIHIPNAADWSVHTDNGNNVDITWDYLTISGCSLATFKGATRINGVTGYKVFVQQTDKTRNPATSNLIRVKVTRTSDNAVMFDTQPGLTEALTATNGGGSAIVGVLDGGTIKVQPSSSTSCAQRADGTEILGNELLQNVPNPFSGTTEIGFTVPEDGHYTLKVYNYLGEEVSTLFNEDAMSGVNYHVTFDGSKMVSGIYMYTLTGENVTETRRMNLIKQ